MFTIPEKMKPVLIVAFLILLTLALILIQGCVAGHGQFSFGTGKKGVEAATAMAAGEAWPAGSGDMSSESKRSISRAARD